MKAKASAIMVVIMLLMSAVFYVFPVQAAPATIKVGVICDKGLTEGLGLWRGTEMARDIINAWHDGKGVYLSSTGEYRKIELVFIDEHAYPLRPDQAVTELQIALPNVDFLIGGFRSECAFPMREAAMDYAAANGKPLWVICGSATTRLIACPGGAQACGSCVRCNYERYKYMFRVTPMNDTYLFKTFVAFIKLNLLEGLTGEGGILAKIYGSPVKTYIVAENLVWTELMRGVLAGKDYYPKIPVMPGVYVDNPYPTPPNPGAVLGTRVEIAGIAEPAWDETDFSTILTDIENKGARLIIHIFSAIAGGSFAKQWGERQVKAVPVGINVESQLQRYWDVTGGKCEYESFLASVGTRTPVVPGVTDKLWDDYYTKYGDYPIYTSFGSYDGLIAAAENMESAGTLDSAVLIPVTEKSERDSSLGRFKYTGVDGKEHDVYSVDLGPTWPAPRYVRPQLPQWQAGRMEVVWPTDQPYSKPWALPPWMYPYSDVTYDGLVDIFDVVTIAKSFGTKPGDKDWNIRADLNKSEISLNLIDIFDVVTIAKDFGTAIPLPLTDP